MRLKSLCVALFLVGAIGMPILSATAQVVTLPAGAKLQVVMETRLNTKDSKSGDAFRSHLVMPVFVD